MSASAASQPEPSSEQERFKLRFGPYERPAAAPGEWLECARRGQVEVVTISRGRVPWPITARRSLILCGDLIRAVKTEAVQAVAYQWGVCGGTARKWRRHLGVERFNKGTRILNDLNCPYRTGASAAMAASPRRRAPRKPKPVASYLFPSPIQAELAKLRRRPIYPGSKLWTRKEESLLGTDTDKAIARRLKRTHAAVRARRELLGLPPVFSSKPWRTEVELLGSVRDAEASTLTGHTLNATQHKRILLRKAQPGSKDRLRRRNLDGLPEARKVVPGTRWTPEEDKLLGTMPDEAIARRLGRPLVAVKARRFRLGLRLTESDVKPWTEKELSCLGKLPDGEVAKKLGRSFIAVAIKRRKIGVAVVRAKPANWTAEEDKLLGSDSDAAVGRLLGRSAVAVTKRRARLQVRPGGVRPWTAEEDQLMGTYPDRELAAGIGRSYGAVKWRRQKLGLPPCPPKRVIRSTWSPEHDKLLGTDSDEAIAAKIGRSVSVVRNRRANLGVRLLTRMHPLWLPEDDRLLGTMTDEELARRLGRTVIAVRARRSILGIRTELHPAGRAWTPAEQALLGKVADADVAKQTGRTRQAVKTRREKLGIRGAVRPLRSWTKAEDELLGTLPDRELARHLGRTVVAVACRRAMKSIPPK